MDRLLKEVKTPTCPPRHSSSSRRHRPIVRRFLYNGCRLRWDSSTRFLPCCHSRRWLHSYQTRKTTKMLLFISELCFKAKLPLKLCAYFIAFFSCWCHLLERLCNRRKKEASYCFATSASIGSPAGLQHAWSPLWTHFQWVPIWISLITCFLL